MKNGWKRKMILRHYLIIVLFFVETILIPKSKNTGKDGDCVYIDMLNGDDIEDFLSFEKKCSSKIPKTALPELIKINDTDEEEGGKLICYWLNYFIINE